MKFENTVITIYTTLISIKDISILPQKYIEVDILLPWGVERHICFRYFLRSGRFVLPHINLFCCL
jgi:hypothetical protein